MNLQPNLPNDMMMGQVTQMSNSSYNGQAQNVQGSGDHHRNHPDAERVRKFVQKKIYDYLIVRGQQQSSDLSRQRMIDLTRLLDKALFSAASTLDEYMNIDTLETRLMFYLKQLRNNQNQRLLQQQQQQMTSGVGGQQQVNSGFGNQNVLQNQNQQFVQQHGSSSGSISTMIPTPGMDFSSFSF